MEGPPLGPGGEDITWPDRVAPRGRKASSARKMKPQTSNLWAPPLSPALSGFRPRVPWALALCFVCFGGLRLPGSLCALASFVCPAWPLVSPWWLLPSCPPPFVSRGLRCCRAVPFFFSCVVRPRCLWLPLVSGPGCPGPQRCAFFPLLASRFSAFRALSTLSCFLPGRWLLPGGCCPPPPFSSCGFRRCRSVLCAVCCAVLCVPGCGAAPRCCALCRPVLCCCVLCCFVAFVWCRCLLCRALWLCLAPWGPVLCGAVFCDVPPRCVLCAVCVLSWGGGARCCSPLCFVLCVSWGAVLCVPFPLRSVRCCALLCWCACVLLFVWCVLLLAPGLVVCCCVLCCFLWCAVVRCWVWRPVMVCRWRVLVPVWPLGLLPCGWCGLLWCPASLCRVLWCCAVAWCCAVVLCCCVAVLLVLALPSCGLSCCAVLCCWLALLFCARWWCLRAVVLFPSCCAVPVFSALCVAVPCCAGCGALLPCVVCCGAVLSRGAVLSCSAVILALLFVLTLPSSGLSCGAVLCCVVLLVVCAVFCLVVAYVWCGALIPPAGTHATIPHTEKKPACFFF